MFDQIHQLIAELEKRGIRVAVGCSHLGWQISTGSGGEITSYVSAREVVSFLTGILCAVTMATKLTP